MWPGCSAASSSTPVKRESDGKAAPFPFWVPQEMQTSLLNCMKTFWWLWGHLPNRRNQNSEQTTLSFLYTQTINSPSRSLAWWCHICFTDREQKTEENKLFVRCHQRNLSAVQRSGLVSPKSQINTPHKGASSSCRLGTNWSEAFYAA